MSKHHTLSFIEIIFGNKVMCVFFQGPSSSPLILTAQQTVHINTSLRYGPGPIMYILILLLMNLTLVMSNTPIIDVSMDAIKHMADLMDFNEKTPFIFKNGKKIFEVYKDFLEEAERNILDMRYEIDNIEYEELTAEDISRYQQVKSSLEKVRQDLIKLGHKTVTDVRDLMIILDDLDESNDPTLFRISIDNMKDLMDYTKKTLEEAKAKYNTAVDDFQSFMFSIQQKNGGLKRNLYAKVRDHDKWTTTARTGEVAIGILSVAGWYLAGPLYLAGFIPAIYTESKIRDYDHELERFRSKVMEIMDKSDRIEKDIKVGIKLITKEIYSIDKGRCQNRIGFSFVIDHKKFHCISG